MTAGLATTPVSTAMVLALVDEAREMGYEPGVIGVRGAPDRALTADLEHAGCRVRIRPAESTLAAREVLAERGERGWLVVVTDRDDDDLGAGVLAHFVWQRLRSPDPWEAVRHRFAATGIDPALTTARDGRDLAAALLGATPPSGWPAAPAGVLTRAHALASVASAHLGLEGDTADVVAVLRWSMRPDSIPRVGTLRALHGDRLTDETLRWVAERAGPAAPPVHALLRQGEIGDVVPLGVVLELLTSDRVQAPELHHAASLALTRLEPRWGQPRPSPAALRALGAAAGTLLGDLVHDRRREAEVARVLNRADALVQQVEAEPLSRYSDLLPRGLNGRLAVLASALRRAVEAGGDGLGPAAQVEQAWSDVCAHRYADAAAHLLRPAAAAVRLSRWLGATPVATDRDVGSLARRYVDHGAWADAAVSDAFAGVDDPELASALGTVVRAAQHRRRAEERAFASALAEATARADSGAADGVTSEAGTIWHLERLLPAVVLPLAKKAPVLLLVLDGMSVTTAIEVLADATSQRGWLEAALPGADRERRGAALAALPSLTEVSRCSLLSGRLARGQQQAERTAYAELTAKSGKVRAELFHKKAVDTTAAGYSVGDDVGAALDDHEVRLVTVVLNTIDDALDRSDPAGTTWDAETVKHLAPLLARARSAGRTVVVTADHGHVVERRQGTQRGHPDISSARSRSATGPVEDGEVEVSGARVLTPDHRAVLAVDEGLRYGPLKAGYHGGASAAEVVVPVAVLVADEDANPLGLPLLPPQVPTWWLAREAADEGVRSGREAVAGPDVLLTRLPDAENTFFAEASPAAVTARSTMGRAVVGSAVYRAQRQVTGRLIVTDDQVVALVDAVVAAGGGAGAGSGAGGVARLPMALAARALGISEARLRGALAQAQQLLNVEGYAVLGADLPTRTVVLDERLLREQFELR